MIITEEIKQQLVKSTARAIINIAGRISYADMKAVRVGDHQLDEMTLATFCLANTLVGRHIPVYPNGIRTLRDYHRCWRVSDVFGLTNIDENRLREISVTEGFTKYQKFGTIRIGRLAFRDNTHEFFESGSGGSLCDFVDLDNGYLIEAKYNYFNGSPSGLHDAEYLLDYGNFDAYLYKTTEVGGKKLVPTGTKPIAYFERIMTPRRHLDSVPGLSADLMQLIKSGELIPQVDQMLAESGFEWKL